MKPQYTTIALVSMLLILSGLVAGCGQKADADRSSGPPVDRPSLTVRVQEVQPEPFAERLEIAGIVKAEEDVLLSTEEGGVLREWKVRKGSAVHKGDVIALLKDDVVRPAFLAAHAQYQIAEMNYKMQGGVFAEQGISELQYRSAEYNRDAAKAAADLARARLERTVIKSPVDGILDDHLVDAGEMTSPGVPIARIISLDRVRVQVNVPERYAGTMTRGSALTMSVLAYPKEVFRSTIVYVGSAVSADNRTITVEGTLPNPGHKLKPEMIAKSIIAQSRPRSAMLIPEAAVQRVDENRFVVYVAVEGKAASRTVTLGSRDAGRVEILTGLVAGDRVVVGGYEQLADGQAVTVAQ